MKNITKIKKENKTPKHDIKKILKRILIIFIIFIFNILNIINVCSAEYTFQDYYIKSRGDCGELLKYEGEIVKTYYAQYSSKAYNIPVYCLDKNKQGITNNLSYYVKAEQLINDVILWRYIINGYPYKSIQTLGCMDEFEAYMATQQAIYCYIHNNKIELYEPIGEKGERVLQAMKQIIVSAQNSAETPIKNTVQIKEIQKNFMEDSINKEYVSKTYEVTSNTTVSSYYVYLHKIPEEQSGKIIVTDLDNQSKNSFKGTEKFKVLIPKNVLSKDCSLQITVKASLIAKDIMYGKPENELYQEYALTTKVNEEIYENFDEKYSENQASLKIIKQDQETNKRLEGVEFNILDENNQIKYENIKTDINGEFTINNIEPGIYYLNEINPKDGYEKLSEVIKITIGLNEEIVITVNNIKKETPTPPTDEKEPSKPIIKQETITPENKHIKDQLLNTKVTTEIQTKKLPVTGM